MRMTLKAWLLALSATTIMTLSGCTTMPTTGNTPTQQEGVVVEGVDGGETGGYYDNGLEVGVITDDSLYGTGEDEAYWQDGGDVITDDTYADGGTLYPDEQVITDQPTQAPGFADGMKPVIYFAFDSYRLSAKDKRKIRYFARKMLRDKRIHVRLEGHTDERGSLEYNLALGERRAKAVAREFRRNGIPYSRMDVISYGELRPAALGHNERAWALNRRVEMIFYRK